MRLIDLTLPVEDSMAVYPGDPPVCVRQIHDLARHGWRLSEIRLGSHTGTHVNAPWHMAPQGARLEALPLECFVGQAVVRAHGPLPEGVGVIYANAPLDAAEFSLIRALRPPFVAQSARFELDAAIERQLCLEGIVSFENLANTELLPRTGHFLFMGLPLAIAGDAAPVRAVAMLNAW